MKKLLTVILLSLTISGCSIFHQKPPEPQIKVVTETIKTPVYHPNLPSPLQFENVEWLVINSDNFEEKRAEVERLIGGDFVVFAVVPETYENMAYNFQEVKRYILQQRDIILYYRSIYSEEDRRDWEEATQRMRKELESQQQPSEE